MVVMVFLVILTTTSVTVLELGRNAYRISMSNQMQAEGRGVAESEMEYLYYRFKTSVMSGEPAQSAPAALALAGVADESATLTPSLPGATPIFVPSTFPAFQSTHRSAGWTVRRAIITDRFLRNERFPGTTKEGSFTYLIAQVEVIPPPSSPFYWEIPPSLTLPAGKPRSYRIGRRFSNSAAPIFQYSIFYQGDLEFHPASAVTEIRGNVIANGSIFMGVQTGLGRVMRIVDQVRYLRGGVFNTPTPWNPNSPSAPPMTGPIFLTSEPSQLIVNDEPENLLGGLDVRAAAMNRPDLFGPSGRSFPFGFPLPPTASQTIVPWTPDELAQAENNIYRSLIVPPPQYSTYGATPGAEYPNATVTSTIPPFPATDTQDDAVISVQRAHVKASLIITVNVTTGTAVVTKDRLSYLATAAFLNPTTPADSVLTRYGTTGGGAPIWTTTFRDQREAYPALGKDVAMIELDVAKLKTKLDTLRGLSPGTSAAETGYFNFTGLLYINLVGAHSGAPAAVKLINATALPYNQAVDPMGGQSGFSVATNGGIYVVGNYNTVSPDRTTTVTYSGITYASGTKVFPRINSGTNAFVPAMLMADAITLLSAGWNDANANAAIGVRVSSAGGTDFNAGILTGQIPASIPNGTTSGGAQNLVRYLENWGGRPVNFFGSIGRLFQPTVFVSRFRSIYNGSADIYRNPTRTFSFDANLLLYPPPATPTSTSFSRGDFFTW